VIQLAILNGKQAGTRWVPRRYPVRIGRTSPSDLCLDDGGVWDQHLQLELRPGDGAVISSSPDAFTAVNGQKVFEAILRNGDLLEIGSVRLLFGLSPTRQASLRLREAVTWSLLGTLGFGQVTLIYWLLQL